MRNLGSDVETILIGEPEWGVISDKQVRHTWECPRCQREVTVSPAYYAGSGTPVCDVCDLDMSYVKTERSVEP